MKNGQLLEAAKEFLWREGDSSGHSNTRVDLMTRFAARHAAELAAELQTITEERDRLREEKDTWRLALESLTPQGSEFVNDLARCVDYVVAQRLGQHDKIVRLVKERDMLREGLFEAQERDCKNRYSIACPSTPMPREEWCGRCIAVVVLEAINPVEEAKR